MDSPASLTAVLEQCNQELAEFSVEWSGAARELKTAEKRYERLYRSALRGTEGRDVGERQATAHAAVEHVEAGLAERIELLVGQVEEFKTKFKVIDRRSNNAQSLLSAHKESVRIESFTPRGN